MHADGNISVGAREGLQHMLLQTYIRSNFKKLCLSIVFLISMSTPAFAAGGEMPSLIFDIGVSLLLAGVLAVIFLKLRIPVIAAFLMAGILAGPLVLGLTTDPKNIDTIAQLGFVLLLFMIGLEIDVKKILGSGKAIILSGLIQYPLTIAFGVVLTKLLIWLGVGSTILSQGPYVPFYVGIVLAGSSTLLVIKLFQERFELDTQPGRVALGMLIFQDVWAIVVMLLQPNLANPQIMPIVFSFVGIGLLGVISVCAARILLRRVFRWISKAPELVLTTSLAWCFLIIFLGLNLDSLTQSSLGFNVHMAVGSGMGALLAGASIASLPHSHEIIAKVGVVKDFFVTLFFVGLGMSIPMPDGPTVIFLALLIAVFAIASRLILFFPLLYITGLDRRTSMVSSVRLAQVSEFGLVIAFLGVQFRHITPEFHSAIIFAFVMAALVTPFLYDSAYKASDSFAPFLRRLGFKDPSTEEEEAQKPYNVAFLGFHRVASTVLYDLDHHRDADLSDVLVIDFNVQIHDQIAARGAHVQYGDLANPETLLHAGIDQAKVVVSTIPDDILRGVTNEGLVHNARAMNPEAVIIANAVNFKDAAKIYEAGADYVYMQRLETGRMVCDAIEHALKDNIDDFRHHCQELHGDLDERDEVFD
jgi:Kef-type K+ transport system membrane component KefB